jgi:protein TonB
MLQPATPPDRPRPALLASIGLHVTAFSVLGFGPLLAFPDLPGWRGEVWAVTQPDLSVLRETRTVDLRERPAPAPSRGASRGGGVAAAPRPGAVSTPLPPPVQPGGIPDELPPATPYEPDGEPGVPGGFDDGTSGASGSEPGLGPGGGNAPYDARGGALPPDLVLPVPLETPAPAYSEAARLTHAAGVVVLSATIASDGRVVDVAVENDAHPLLERLAVEAVSRWRYAPARVGAHPVSVVLRVTLTFRLR